MSRYDNSERYTVPGPHGQPVTVATTPVHVAVRRRGTHLRRDGQRLDHLAAHYLDDPAGFWQICDANDAMVPEALADVIRLDIPEARR